MSAIIPSSSRFDCDFSESDFRSTVTVPATPCSSPPRPFPISVTTCNTAVQTVYVPPAPVYVPTVPVAPVYVPTVQTSSCTDQFVWTEWSACDKTCGSDGKRTRRQFYLSQALCYLNLTFRNTVPKALCLAFLSYISRIYS